MPDPALGDEDVEEPEGVAADFFALAVAFGPSAGSFPFAIWAASSRISQSARSPKWPSG